MTLKQFAELAGCHVVPCTTEGRYAYKTDYNQNCIIVGFKTKAEAYMGWLQDEFGEHLSKAVIKLLEASE